MISAHYYWPEKQKKSLKLISLYYSNESFFSVFLHLAVYFKNHHTQILYITVYNWMKNKHCYPGEENKNLTYTGICTSSLAKVFTCLQHQNWRGEEQIVTLCYTYQNYIYTCIWHCYINLGFVIYQFIGKPQFYFFCNEK